MLHIHTHTHISTCAYRHTHPSPCGHLFSVHQDCRPNPRRIISSMPGLFMCNGSHLSPSLSPPMLPFAPSPPPLNVPSSFRHNRSHCCSHKMPTPTFCFISLLYFYLFFSENVSFLTPVYNVCSLIFHSFRGFFQPDKSTCRGQIYFSDFQ